jgi:signal transduction histidine kinase
MNPWKLEFGVKNKAIAVFIFLFLAILLFNGYLGVSALNQAKQTSLDVGNTILLEQSETYYRNFTNAQNETLELLLKTIEDDVNNLKDFTIRLFTNDKYINAKSYWNYKDHLKHLPNNQLVESSSDLSTLWSPTWMKVDEAVYKKIEISAYLNEYFEPLLNRNENTVANYFLGDEGFLRYYPKKDMLAVFPPDFRTIDGIFYKPAAPEQNPQRKLVWTPLYKDPAGLGWMISAIAPIYVENEFFGVVGTDMTLENLVKHYITQDEKSDSYSILLDKSFRPIALPPKAINDIYRKNLNADDELIEQSLLEYESSFKTVFQQIENQHSGFEKVILDDAVRYISYVKLDKLDWVYANVLSEKALLSVTETLNQEIDANTDKLILRFTLPTLAFFVLLIFFISWLINRFLRPIVKLSDITRSIAFGEIEQDINIKARNEIGVLINNFKSMQQAIIKQKRGLENFNTALQEKVDERTEAIEASNEALQTMVHNLKYMQDQIVESEKMASLGTLTAGVAHEINNPTNFVHVSVQNLEADLTSFERFIFGLLKPESDSEIKHSFTQQFVQLHQHIITIIEGTERIKTIVRNLRTFTHPDSPQKKMMNIADGLQSTINLVQTKHLKLVNFVTDFRSNPALLCYPSELNQVFMNLIINACDAIRERRLNEPRMGQGELIIGCFCTADTIEITMQDNGCGMNEVTKRRLFEPFFTTKEVGEGTGLGMSISYGIIQKHGGELKVESEVGKGTSFRLILPICYETKEEKAKAKVKANAQAQAEKVVS